MSELMEWVTLMLAACCGGRALIKSVQELITAWKKCK